MEKKDNNYYEPLFKIINDPDSTTLKSLQVWLPSWGDSDYRFFKLNRNENTEDKIIAFYEDMPRKECMCIGKKLIKIIYNEKEYPVEDKHLVHEIGDHKIPPIDILVE